MFAEGVSKPAADSGTSPAEQSFPRRRNMRYCSVACCGPLAASDVMSNPALSIRSMRAAPLGGISVASNPPLFASTDANATAVHQSARPCSTSCSVWMRASMCDWPLLAGSRPTSIGRSAVPACGVLCGVRPASWLVLQEDTATRVIGGQSRPFCHQTVTASRMKKARYRFDSGLFSIYAVLVVGPE